MFSGNNQYDWLMKTLENSLRFGKSDPAKCKLHVLEHYYKYGWKPTVEAFKIGKMTGKDSMSSQARPCYHWCLKRLVLRESDK